MKVVLVMLGNCQPYILDNIENLRLFDNKDITVITNQKFESFFKRHVVTVELVEELIPQYAEETKAAQKTYRNGFLIFTTYRFVALHAFMQKYHLTNIIHIENDVLVYRCLDSIPFHTYAKILITMDAPVRCIPGMMFIPNHRLLQKCIRLFHSDRNDMVNWALCYYNFPFVDTLPIFIDRRFYIHLQFLTKNFSKYNCIFDGAAIGQLIGGVDPSNTPGNTVGFINETCLINYSKYAIVWKYDPLYNQQVPFLEYGENDIPIINLHIHSKNLKKFIHQ